jgi:hypothetical protein
MSQFGIQYRFIDGDDIFQACGSVTKYSQRWPELDHDSSELAAGTRIFIKTLPFTIFRIHKSPGSVCGDIHPAPHGIGSGAKLKDICPRAREQLW